MHGCLIADFTASRLGGGGPAGRTAHARACTTKHAARHRFAGWSGISGRQRSRHEEVRALSQRGDGEARGALVVARVAQR